MLFVSAVRKCKGFVVSLFNLKRNYMRPMINLLILNVLPLLYRNNCNSAPNLNIRTVFPALKTLECVYLKKNTVPCKMFSSFPGIYKKKQHLRWGG